PCHAHLRVSRLLLQLPPEALDEGAEVVALVEVGGAPYLSEQGAVVDDRARAPGQLRQQPILGGRERDLRAVANHGSGSQVDDDASDSPRWWPRRLAAPAAGRLGCGPAARPR